MENMCYICGNLMETICNSCQYKNMVMEDIETDVKSTSLKAPDKTVILDVRQGFEQKLANIHNSILIPLQELPNRLAELPKEKEIITYCHTGVRSLHAAKFLKQQGFNAKSMVGGIDAWTTYIDPTVPRY